MSLTQNHFFPNTNSAQMEYNQVCGQSYTLNPLRGMFAKIYIAWPRSETYQHTIEHHMYV